MVTPVALQVQIDYIKEPGFRGSTSKGATHTGSDVVGDDLSLALLRLP
jgi:hypothetical protein